MPRTMLNDQHWSKLETILRNFDIYLKRNLRNFIEAILYRIRTGCPWRDLPPDFGNPNSIFKKYSRWSKHNKLLKIFKLISKHTDKEWIFIDGSHIRAHQHSAGLKDQAISKSIGGNSSKIHLAVDSYGNPIEIMITNGTTHDVKVAPELVEKLDLEKLRSYVQIRVMILNHYESKSEQQILKLIFHGSQILSPTIIIWIGIYIKLGT